MKYLGIYFTGTGNTKIVCQKAKEELGWNPTKTSFEELVKKMVDHDMKKVALEVI